MFKGKALTPKTIVDDLHEIYDFPPFIEEELVSISLEHLILWSVDLLPSSSFVASTSELEAFKEEIIYEMAAQRAKQQAMSTKQEKMDLKLDAEISKQDAMDDKPSKMLNLLRRNP